MPENTFIGTWRLVSYVAEDADGQITYPFGEDAEGYIMYRDDGYMQVAIMAPDRPRFESGRMREGTMEEKAAASQGYISYAGTYTICDDTITHHVEVAWFPNMVGQDNVRRYRMDGNRVRLSVPPVDIDGKTITQHLTWERV